MPISIDDVAARAKVSTATVSRAMRGLPRVSPETRSRVLAIAEEMGYVPSPSARGLATGRTKTMGVLAPFADRWYFGHAIEGVEQALREDEFNLLLFSLGGYGKGRQRTFRESMVRKQIDALVVLCLSLDTDELDELHRTDIPLIAVGGPVQGCSSVCIDDSAAATAATNHLIGLGHRRIGHVYGGIQDKAHFVVPALRSDAFTTTMRQAGLPVRPDWSAPGDFTVKGGAEAAGAIFDAPGERPTAIFCASDEMALGLMYEARRRGIRIPEELSVIGIDDHDFSAVAGLTTVAQDPTQHGYLATRLLLAQLNGTPANVENFVMPFHVILRASTAPPAVP